MNNIFDLKSKKNWKQAILFYVIYFVIGLTIVFVAGSLFGILVGDKYPDTEAFDIGFRLGQFVAILLVIGLTIYILRQKEMYKNSLGVLLGLLAIILSVLGGILLGLLPLAYLLTREIPPVSDEQITKEGSSFDKE